MISAYNLSKPDRALANMVNVFEEGLKDGVEGINFINVSTALDLLKKHIIMREGNTVKMDQVEQGEMRALTSRALIPRAYFLI